MDQITYIPLAALRECPFNPRKTYADTALQELANSIGTQGVLQPIVVRPLSDMQTDMEHRYEIVFGHRRARAARLAGLESAPCILREMDDEQAAIAQAHENTKREDVTAIEEADSFAHLHKHHRLSADQIAEAVGKSRSYVYGRMKLANASPELRKASTEQGLSAETAQEIARLPHHDMQRKALKELRNPYAQTAERPVVWTSTRDATATLQRLFTVRLAGAPFDLTDAELARFAGACTSCRKCAANDPDLGSMPADSCLDRSCYGGKVKAHELRLVQLNQERIAAWLAEGRKVIQGDEAKALWFNQYGTLVSDHEPVTQDLYGDDLDRSIADGLASMGESAPATVLILNPHNPSDLREFLANAHINAVRAHLGLPPDDEYTVDTDATEGTSTPTSAARGADVRESVDPLTQCVTTNWGTVLREIMRAVLTTPRTTDDLRLITSGQLDLIDHVPNAVLEVFGWREALATHSYGEDVAHVESQLPSLSADRLAALALCLALIDAAPGSDGTRTGLIAARLALAERYQVNVLAACGLNTDQSVDGGCAAGASAQADLLAEGGA